MGTIIHNASDGPTVICGIVIYGIEYIKGKLDKLVEWKTMNPGVTFVIMTIRLVDENADKFSDYIKTLRELKDNEGNVVFGTLNDDVGIDGVIDVIDIPFIEWLIKYTHSLRLPVHYISDILRWYCLDILVKMKKTDYACVMEADLTCLKDDWIINYIKSKTTLEPSPIKDKISIFGSDRTFIMHNGNTEILKEIILSFNDIYQYFIQTNLYSSNLIYFINQIKTGKKENGNEHYYKTHYDNAIRKINPNNTFDKEQIDFITSIPLSSQMGINIRQNAKYNFNLTSSANDDPQIDSYKHENLANWLVPTEEYNSGNETEQYNNSGDETEEYNNSDDEKSPCTTSPTKKRRLASDGGGKKTKKNKRKTLKYKRKTLKYKRKTLKRG